MPLILPGNVASATASTGYTVDNSCRFNSADSAYLSKTTGTATNTDQCTISFWVKRGVYSSDHKIITNYTDTSNRCYILFAGDEYLQVFQKLGGSTTIYLKTDRLFRDHSAWYNIIVAVDTSQVTESDRVKIYVNGVQETSFSSETYPSQNENFRLNESSVPLEIGRAGLDTQYFNGYLSEFVLLDGQTLTPTSFGEFDEDSPTIWKPIDVSGLTFGDNGFYLDFQNSAELGTDVSGNSNTFTENNLDATDQATDTPTNNFCTINPLDFAITGTAPTISQGNCLYTSSGAGAGSNNAIRSTIAVSNGKWYWESKWIQNPTVWGMQNADAETRWNSNGYLLTTTGTWGIHTDGSKTVNGTQTSSVFTALSTNDIVGLAFDLDNGKFYMSVNGTFVTSGDPTSGATGTGSLGDLTSGLSYMPVICNANYDSASIAKMNFGGSPAFTVSSGNADGDGYGNFEYAVPSGYYALCTKNLGAYGG